MYKLDRFDDGAFEILVSGGGIGYARLKVGNLNDPTNVRNWSIF